MDRSRLEAFSDGVFAVAITLLALDLTVYYIIERTPAPAAPDDPADGGQFAP